MEYQALDTEKDEVFYRDKSKFEAFIRTLVRTIFYHKNEIETVLQSTHFFCV